MRILNIILASLLTFLFISHCTSNVGDNSRNADIFGEAASTPNVSYTTTNYDFDGNISNIRTTISALTIDTTTTSTLSGSVTDRTISGIVTVPSSADILMYQSTASDPSCRSPFRLYNRSFVIQDKDSAIFIAYGRMPPVDDESDAQLNGFGTNSMEYRTNASRTDMAVMGDRIEIVAKAGINYGSGTTGIPIITDFDSRKIISRGNSIFYETQPSSSDFARADLFKNKQISGIVKTTPTYSECPSNSTSNFVRDFQLVNDIAYSGTINVGGSVDSNGNITGGRDYKFRLTQSLAQGTLSTFNVANQFSYTLLKGARVKITGPLFIPVRGGDDTNLMILLDQKSQVENLQ